MGDEEVMDQILSPLVLFCARHRIRVYESVKDLVDTMLLALEGFGFVDVVDPDALDSLIEEAIHGIMDSGLDLDPPLTFAQEQVLRDLLNQMKGMHDGHGR